ncbi:MAG TPA: hypothetical protein VMQ59_09790 [Acidimicrobiales bacterium]|jgi:hypothetical protein|nr:hypothetical protein [Acidimicrobiales bacterium]
MTFWQEALPYAQQCHAGTGVLTSVLLAQAAVETGYGGYDWSVAHNPGNVGSFDGQPVNEFPSLEAGTLAWIQTFNNGYYQAVKSAVGWQSQCYALGNSPWASGHYIANGVKGQILVEIIQTNNLTQYDGPQPSPAPPPIPAVPIPEGNMQVTDPDTGGIWVLDPTNGAVFAEAVEGSGIPPYLGGFNIHPDWGVNLTQILGISAFGAATDHGYVVSVRGANGIPAQYAFTRNGQYATPTS